MATYEVWTIAPDCTERYVGLVDGANEDEAGARADELYGHGNPGGLELREQRWPVSPAARRCTCGEITMGPREGSLICDGCGADLQDTECQEDLVTLVRPQGETT
jgi:hypothetical protein